MKSNKLKINNRGGVNMKTLTKMFLLSCWCLISVSFAKETLDEIKANQEQQLIQEKLEILESQTQETKEPRIEEEEECLDEIQISTEGPILIPGQGSKEIPIPNYSNDGIDKEALLESKMEFLNSLNSGSSEPLSIEDLDQIQKEIKEEILAKGYTVEEYINAVNADRISNQKEGAVSFETYLQGLDAKEQAVSLEYIFHPTNNEG